MHAQVGLRIDTRAGLGDQATACDVRMDRSARTSETGCCNAAWREEDRARYGSAKRPVNMARPVHAIRTALSEDGGSNMTPGELGTARRFGLGLKVAVVNTVASCQVKALQHAMYGAATGPRTSPGRTMPTQCALGYHPRPRANAPRHRQRHCPKIQESDRIT